MARGSSDGARRRVLQLAAGTVTLGAATGIGTQLGVVDTSSVRWVHHLLYAASIATCVTAAAIHASLGGRHRAAMVPAVVVLGLLGRTRGGTRRHVAVGTMAASAAWFGAVRG